MTKKDLVAEVAGKVEITKADAENAINTIIAAMTKAIKSAGRFTLYGFGTFELVTREARTARNPRTGDKVFVPPKRVVKFKMAADLKRWIL